MNSVLSSLLKIAAFLSFGGLLVMLALNVDFQRLELTLCCIGSLSAFLLIRDRRKVS
ncbi:hypothetical protein [Falsibacillus albus]|uniref:hypothetical protein n=1 Tax=Falsibacillus albus TaxID=2478915 RepID=UPI001314AFC0|nr:hypothetical protein [Falsibacillus albus]